MGNDIAEPSATLTKASARDFYIYIDTLDPKEAIKIFDALSAGGKIIMPIAETFWSPVYGILTDKFGISWKLTSHQATGE